VHRALLAACLSAVLAAGCSASDPPAGERLGDLGEALVPQSAALVKVSEGACPQLAGNPSCARVFFTSQLPEQERVDALEEAARSEGWEVVGSERRSDGVLVELSREGFRAFAAVYEDAHAAPCAQEPDTDCADELQVIEDV
jgi:hypothetical protein